MFFILFIKERKMKKFKILFLCLVFCLSMCFSACGNNFSIVTPAEIKNVILLIGDGMGFNHIENTKLFFDIEEFSFEKVRPYSVTTFSKDNDVTDSAAAATALATGNKTINGSVSRLDGQDFEHIMSIAQTHGKKTGVITNDSLSGATPACFSSHANSRYSTNDIIDGQTTSNIDILLGQESKSYEQRKVDFENNGYTYASTIDELLQCNSQQKIVANIPNIKSKYNTNLANQTDFAEIVNFTLNHLENENGFCLMIENAYIDKNSHSNNLYDAMCEVRSFADSIQAVFDFCQGRNDTMVLITADHETGGLLKATAKAELSNSLYTTESHTSANVPLYLYGSKLKGVKGTIDNTQIFSICKSVMR